MTKILLALLPLFSLLSFAQTKTSSRPSSMYHRISSGGFMHQIKKRIKGEVSRIHDPGYFAEYSLYPSEIHRLFNDRYRSYLQLGFTGGIKILAGENHHYNKQQLCINKRVLPIPALFLNGGLEVKSAYFKKLNPFVGYGSMLFTCAFNLRWLSHDIVTRTKDSIPLPSKIRDKLPDLVTMFPVVSYASFGLDLSLGVFGDKLLEALDRNFNVNDLNIRLECLIFFKNFKTLLKKRYRPMCSAGLSLVF